MVRTRVAVSPTGYPHIGTIYQSLFDYAYAKKNNGIFIVRIEDTDRERFVPDAQERLYQALDWFLLAEDESPRKGGPHTPYVQSERLPLYQKYAQELLERGFAYYCFCSKERLGEVRQKRMAAKMQVMYDKHCRNLSTEEIDKKLAEGGEKVVRLKVPENKTITVRDEIRGDISFDSNLIDDQVLLKSDGFPTYHLAMAVDDHLMEITDVVRAEEWLPSFPKHKLLYEYLGWQMPKFYHTSALRNPDHSKLSKRQGHTNVSWYQEQGYLPEAILNYIALLGWSAPADKEIFSLNEFVQMFDLKDIKPIGPVFDVQKLSWMNGVYIRNLTVDQLSEKLHERYPEYKKMEPKTFLQIVSLAQSRMETLNDFPVLTAHFLHGLSKEDYTDEEKSIVRHLHSELEKLTDWSTEKILDILRNVLKTYKIKMPVLYTLFTGAAKGLPLPESLVLLGKDEVLQRLSF